MRKINKFIVAIMLISAEVAVVAVEIRIITSKG